MPHGMVSKCRLSGETVRDGWVTTERSRTCTVGPCSTCRDKKQESEILHVLNCKAPSNPVIRKCGCTCMGMTTLMSPIFTLDPCVSNFTVKVCVSPQGRFFTRSNSTVKPETTHTHLLKRKKHLKQIFKMYLFLKPFMQKRRKSLSKSLTFEQLFTCRFFQLSFIFRRFLIATQFS